MNINGIDIEFKIEQTEDDYFLLTFLNGELWKRFDYWKWEEWDIFGDIILDLEKDMKLELKEDDDYFLLMDEVYNVYSEMGDYIEVKEIDGIYCRSVIYNKIKEED